MYEFLRFFEEKRKVFPMHLYIGYNKTTDWTIEITKKGMASEYPDARHIGPDVLIVDIYANDMELAFAKAHVELKEWLVIFEGGY